MKISFIKPSHKFEMVGDFTPNEILAHIERAGRTCYKSEEKITEDSSQEFVRKIIKMGHESVLEHFSFSIRFICDRGVTHEMVRHRIASFSQESTRYVGYGDATKFILPLWCNLEPMEFESNDTARIIKELPLCTNSDAGWAQSMASSAVSYAELLSFGWAPQQARSVLPNSLKTEIVVTANLREWRHIFKLRAESSAAHPQIREVMIPALEEAKTRIPVVFDDIMVD